MLNYLGGNVLMLVLILKYTENWMDGWMKGCAEMAYM